MEACHELFWFFGDFYASGMQDAEVTKSLVVHVLGVCIFAYSSTCEQSNKKSGARLKIVGLCASCYTMLNDFGKKIWLLCSFGGGGPSFRPEYEIVQSYNHAYLTLLFFGVTLWATLWIVVSLSQDVLKLMALFAASFVVIGLIKRSDQSISPDFI